MPITHYGNVNLSAARPQFDAHRRFIALLDILGTRRWLEAAGPEVVAAEVAAIVDVTRQAGVGTEVLDDGSNVTFGPLIGTHFFSDTLLAYSVDDSWASFDLLCTFLGQLIAIALRRDIPIRGAVTVGEMVIDQPRGLFVGAPLDEHTHPIAITGIEVLALI